MRRLRWAAILGLILAAAGSSLALHAAVASPGDWPVVGPPVAAPESMGLVHPRCDQPGGILSGFTVCASDPGAYPSPDSRSLSHPLSHPRAAAATATARRAAAGRLLDAANEQHLEHRYIGPTCPPA